MGSAPGMGDSENLDSRCGLPKNDGKRKTPEQGAARGGSEQRELLGRVSDSLDCLIKLVEKASRSSCAPMSIPFECRVQLRLRAFVEEDCPAQRRTRAASRSRTSSHGISRARPSSRATIRRSISSRQACSASGSIWVSRLLRSESASAARASAGNSRAS